MPSPRRARPRSCSSSRTTAPTTAYLTLCRCHGIAVVESDPVKVWAEDDESKDRFGYLPYTNVGKFLTNIDEAQDRCDHFLAIYKDPVPIISFDLKANYDSAHLAEAQVRDVSDRITIQAGAPYGLYIDEDFFVEWIRHSVGRDKLHVVTLLCSSVVSHHWPASGTPYEPKVIPPPTTGGSPHVPDDLWTNAIASGLRLAIGAVADKWNVDIDEAEMRAQLFAEGFSETSVDLRTPAEGGTLDAQRHGQVGGHGPCGKQVRHRETASRWKRRDACTSPSGCTTRRAGACGRTATTRRRWCSTTSTRKTRMPPTSGRPKTGRWK